MNGVWDTVGQALKFNSEMALLEDHLHAMAAD
jgi:hypothetical protein